MTEMGDGDEDWEWEWKRWERSSVIIIEFICINGMLLLISKGMYAYIHSRTKVDIQIFDVREFVFVLLVFVLKCLFLRLSKLHYFILCSILSGSLTESVNYK